MIKKTILIALRSLRKHPGHTAINIIGLTLGLAVFILITLYLAHEVSYDRYHEHSGKTYRVINDSNFNGVGETSTSSPCPLMESLLNEYPGQIKYAGRVFNNWNSEYFMEYNDKGFKEQDFFFADSGILDIFDVEFIRGNPQTALRQPMTMLITESAAKKYFGEENPVGKKLRYEERFSFTITGLIQDAPANTHLKYEFLASMSSLEIFYGGQMPQTWYWNPFWTYLVLEKNVTPENLESQFPAFVKKYFPVAQSERKRLYLQPLEDIHLHSDLDYEIGTNGSYSTIVILATITVFMLLIAVINFINLSTATAAGRAKETGIKKVLGSRQYQLVIQFLTEALVMALAAIVLALIIIYLFLPLFNDFTSRTLSFSTLFTPAGLGLLLLLLLITGIGAGLYPALFLARYSPHKVLKGDVSRGMRSVNARKVLVTFQFAVAIALIIGTSVVYLQLNFLKKAPLGFNAENVILIPVSRTPVVQKYAAFEGALLQHPDIKYVTTTEYIPGTDHNNHEFKPEGYPDDEWQFYPTMIVREDFLRLFEIPVIAGRYYSRKHRRDKHDGILINEAMVKHMGWQSNEAALGKKFHSLGGEERVIGVFKNFKAKSLHTASSPFVLNMKEEPRTINYFAAFVAVKYAGDNPQAIISFLEKTWHTFAPARPFEYIFQEKALETLYDNEAKLGKLSAILTILILFIAVLGLVGLVSFMTHQRAKTISVRRILGASTSHIIHLISKEFIILIALACAIAWPVIYLVAKNWLEGFAHQTGINYWIFALSGFTALIVSLSITILMGIAITRQNPVIALRNE
jgi:putative ABC transport system permease protein